MGRWRRGCFARLGGKEGVFCKGGEMGGVLQGCVEGCLARIENEEWSCFAIAKVGERGYKEGDCEEEWYENEETE